LTEKKHNFNIFVLVDRPSPAVLKSTSGHVGAKFHILSSGKVV